MPSTDSSGYSSSQDEYDDEFDDDYDDELYEEDSPPNKDVMVRLTLDVQEDWDDSLEEFCRLRRLGLVKEAKKHFLSTLEHVSSVPYVRVQYAEMLQLSGDYKGFQNLDFPPEFPPNAWEETIDDRSRAKLVVNYILLDLLSQRPSTDYLQRAWAIVRNTLNALTAETFFGSTEGSVWDFKDLFLAAVSVFGWQETLASFFETTHLPRVLDTIQRDWSQPDYDESSVMCLLDIFTSLIIEDHSHGMTPRNSLLIHYAGGLAESAERHNSELMRSRPFIQWFLASSLHELEAPPEHFDGVRLEHCGGLKLDRGAGVQLPIYIPTRHSARPHWGMFSFRSTPERRRAIEIAIRAADELGDYSLQATAIKLLILQSQDPRPWLETLGRLQLETQGDREGYLATCLSKHLIATDPGEQAALLRELERPSGTGSGLDFERCENSSLIWTWSIIRVLLAQKHGEGASVASDQGGPSPFTGSGLRVDGSRLPQEVAEFTRSKLGIPVLWTTEPLPVAESNVRNNDVQASQWPGSWTGALEQENPFMLRNPAAMDSVNPAVEVKDWPSTWYEGATRGEKGVHRGSADPNLGNAEGQGQRSSPTEPEKRQDDGNDQAGPSTTQRPGQKEDGKDPNKTNDGSSKETIDGEHGGARAAVPKTSADGGMESTARDGGMRKTGILEELENCEDSYESPAPKDRAASSEVEKQPHVTVENGVTKLNFPSDLLEGSGMTILLTDKKDPQHLKAFIVEKGGIFETIASGGGDGRDHRRRRRRRPLLSRPSSSAATAHDQGKSEFNIRTRSVYFDAEGSSSDATVKRHPPPHQGSRSTSRNASRSTSRSTSRPAARQKGKEREQSGAAHRAGGGDHADGQGGASSQEQQQQQQQQQQPTPETAQASEPAPGTDDDPWAAFFQGMPMARRKRKAGMEVLAGGGKTAPEAPGAVVDGNGTRSGAEPPTTAEGSRDAANPPTRGAAAAPEAAAPAENKSDDDDDDGATGEKKDRGGGEGQGKGEEGKGTGRDGSRADAGADGDSDADDGGIPPRAPSPPARPTLGSSDAAGAKGKEKTGPVI
ncbi:hypothetical protein C8A05DRAFT_33571 [Staphylotrichum tortipilum]|uniref:Uncharacterized protein n=1 Tax=Staphylotrichum tortipilum TaxID=2831512 RepID=A0AAN6MLN6_9PEZI|nr:hypothetical protein C8A05DRAFT_33571 [Staphylotrichum longicolle]